MAQTPSTEEPATRFLDRGGGLPRLAYKYSAPQGGGAALPTAVFLGGYVSDMSGTKATHLEAACRARGQGFLRLDYGGHGESGGRFADGTIGDWLADARAVIDHATGGRPLVLVGSSMGGWMALLIAARDPGRVGGVVGIAAAPDFTRWGIEDAIDDAQRAALEARGRITLNGGTYTKKLIEEARGHRVLGGARIAAPIALLQGKADDVVPWETAERIRAAFPQARVTYIDDGDHRLSRPGDLALIEGALQEISAQA